MTRLGLACLMTVTVSAVACSGKSTSDANPPDGGSGGGSGDAALLDSSTSTSCTLAVVASGALQSALPDATQLGGPAVVAIDDGFVIAHREQSTGTGQLQLVASHLSDGAALREAASFDLGGCAGLGLPAESGIGAAVNGSSGVLVSALPNCGIGAGAVFAPFDSSGDFGTAKGPKNPSFTDLSLAHAGAVAAAATSGEFEFVYRVVLAKPEIQRAVLTTPNAGCAPESPCAGSEFKPVPIETPFGDSAAPFAMVATTSQLRALLAPLGANTRLLVGPNDAKALSPTAELLLPSADRAALTAWDSSVAAVVPTAGQPTWASATLSGSDLANTKVASFGEAPLTGAALAPLRDHVFVLGASAGQLTLYDFRGAQADVQPTPAGTVHFNDSVGTASLAGFDGQHVALAAARNQVAVVWLTGSELASGSALGGWALLSCAD
jgi:hypothetical protein